MKNSRGLTKLDDFIATVFCPMMLGYVVNSARFDLFSQGFIRNYFADTVFTFATYNFLRILNGTAALKVVGSMIPAVTHETLQYFGAIPGTYDSKDFLAYASGTAIAYGLEKLVSLKSAKRSDN